MGSTVLFHHRLTAGELNTILYRERNKQANIVDDFNQLMNAKLTESEGEGEKKRALINLSPLRMCREFSHFSRKINGQSSINVLFS